MSNEHIELQKHIIHHKEEMDNFAEHIRETHRDYVDGVVNADKALSDCNVLIRRARTQLHKGLFRRTYLEIDAYDLYDQRTKMLSECHEEVEREQIAFANWHYAFTHKMYLEAEQHDLFLLYQQTEQMLEKRNKQCTCAVDKLLTDVYEIPADTLMDFYHNIRNDMT